MTQLWLVHLTHWTELSQNCISSEVRAHLSFKSLCYSFTPFLLQFLCLKVSVNSELTARQDLLHKLGHTTTFLCFEFPNSQTKKFPHTMFNIQSNRTRQELKHTNWNREKTCRVPLCKHQLFKWEIQEDNNQRLFILPNILYYSTNCTSESTNVRTCWDAIFSVKRNNCINL